MIVLGLVIGLWFRPQASQAATTAVMLALSMLGGLWFPLDMMPDAMAAVGRCLPSYWVGRLAVWPLTGGDFPWTGVGVLALWAVGLCALGVLGYRRAVRTSRR
jgi:ABC-2 type transport system permease protein